MKNFLLVLFVASATFFGSCNKDEDEPQSVSKYEATIKPSCNTSSSSTYCISEAENTRLKNIPFSGDPCVFVVINTLDNQRISGYLKSHGTANGSCP